MTSSTLDALDEAMTAPPPPSLERTYFGQVVIVDAYACVLQKGTGKMPFDPGIHSADQKRIAVKLGIACQSKDGNSYSVDQDTINGSKEWREFTLPSLQAIGKDLRSLNGCYVQVKRKPTGERYQNKTSGEWRDRTALVFTATYPDAEAMQAAAEVFYSKPLPSVEEFSQAAAAIRKPTAQAQPVPAIAIDRKVAADMIDMFWKLAQQDKNKFVDMLQQQPMLEEFHNLDQPEVTQYIGEDWMPF